MPIPTFPKFIAFLLAACSVAYPQAAPVPVEQRILHITSNLTPAIIIKGDLHAAHTLAERMAALHIPGVSIAVIHEGKIEWARGFGVRSLNASPVTADTRFQAASISKPVAAMAALRLVEHGKLALDTDINTHLTTWRLPADPITDGKPVTLRQLLTHTAGITVHGFPGYASGAPVPTLTQVLNGEKPANTAPIRSEAAPATIWQYSGGGFTVVQQALIDVTHQPFPQLVHDSVLAPIGMSHSTYEQPLPPALRSDSATPYQSNGEPIQGGAHTYPEMAAAGLWTTPSDLARYAIEVQQSLQGKANHVLSANMTRQMLTPGLGHWGLGLQIGGSIPGDLYLTHGGSNEGFRCLLVAYEKRGEGAVVMTNSDSGGQLADEIMRSIATEYEWPDYHATVHAVIQVDSKTLADYTGTYRESSGFEMQLTAESAQLFGHIKGEPQIPLYATSPSAFFSTDISAEIEFVKDAEGRVTHLILRQGSHDMKMVKE